MKIRSMVAFAGTLLFTGSLAQAAFTDITISDGLLADSPPGYPVNANGLFGSTSDSRFADPKQREFGEVENGNVEDAIWDLRAFGYDYSTNKLAYQGGFNPLQESSGFGIGSIFIKLGGANTPLYYNNLLQGINGTGGPNIIIPNEFTGPGSTPGTLSFDYAITLSTSTISPSTLNYQIYSLTKDSLLEMPYYSSNSEAGPYKYSSNGGLLFSGTSSVDQLSSADVNTKGGNSATGIQGFGVNDNWFAELNLSSISGQFTPGTTFHLTQECGNDSMVGRLDIPQGTSSIPEPGNMVGLMGLLVGSTFLRFRRRA